MKSTGNHRGQRLSTLFAGTKPIIPFLTAGFPTRKKFEDAAVASVEAGAGALEIGMPFSDPLADGPAIQHSSQAALAQGVTLRQVLDMTAAIRRRVSVPIFLMGYLNPMLRMGLDRFASAACESGADGTIIPDCPLEEAGELIGVSRQYGLSNIFLIAPTTPGERVVYIDRMSSVFSYCVSIAGVTGARKNVGKATIDYLKRVRSKARKPFVVGFGIAKPDHVRVLRPFADGFVVGSAIVPILISRDGRSRVRGVERLIKQLVRAAE